MTKREILFFLMGLGLGLLGILAFICVPEIFFFAFFWHHGLLLVLLLLLIAGTVVLFRLRSSTKPVNPK